MSAENTAGLGVNNWYGPRTQGGESGPYAGHFGIDNWWAINFPQSGLSYLFPTGNGIHVIGVDAEFVTSGTVTHITIGGVAVYDSTTPVTYPVTIAEGNTGVVVVTTTGTPAGTFLLQYRNITGDTTHFV